MDERNRSPEMEQDRPDETETDVSLTAAFRSDGAVRICAQLDEAKVNLTIFSSGGVNLVTFSELFKGKK